MDPEDGLRVNSLPSGIFGGILSTSPDEFAPLLVKEEEDAVEVDEEGFFFATPREREAREGGREEKVNS